MLILCYVYKLYIDNVGTDHMPVSTVARLLVQTGKSQV